MKALRLVLLLACAHATHQLPSLAGDIFGTEPNHVHMTLTGRTGERSLSYVTSRKTAHSVCQLYSSSGDLKDALEGDQYEFQDGNGYRSYIHTFVLTGLEEGTSYTYRVGEDTTFGKWSDNFTFTMKDTAVTYAVYGDLGIVNDVSFPQLKSDLESLSYDAVLHIGDFAYDLDKDTGKVGDEFLAAMQPITASVPYLVSPGNHEKELNFSHYKNRFANHERLGANSGSGTNLWYSYEQDLVHFISLDSEIDYDRDDDERDRMTQRQMAWFEADLASVDRTRTPWLVVLVHKSWWMDHLYNWTHMVELMHLYGVDIQFVGHQHNYQRIIPNFNGTVWDSSCVSADNQTYTNPKVMTTIVVGSPGCSEKISGWGVKYVDESPYYELEYGFGLLQFPNATHMQWRWVRTGVPPPKPHNALDKSAIDPTLDLLTLVVDKHGPRKAVW